MTLAQLARGLELSLLALGLLFLVVNLKVGREILLWLLRAAQPCAMSALRRGERSDSGGMSLLQS